jgi:hypothetical protein
VQQATGRPAHAQARIAGQRHAAYFLHQDAGFHRRSLVLARPDQFDRVAARSKPDGQPLHGEGDTVDLGRIGFADDADAHGRPRGYMPSIVRPRCASVACR